jgi:hypothetical protein
MSLSSAENGMGHERLGDRMGKEDRTRARVITYLDLSPQDKMCITIIRETKDSAKLLHGEIADVANFELGGLARDPRRKLMSERAGSSDVMREQTHLGAHL